MPDFNGSLRLMAVAWSADKLGHADRMLTVRDPVVADLVLPRFLAPGDHASARRSISTMSKARPAPISPPSGPAGRSSLAERRADGGDADPDARPARAGAGAVARQRAWASPASRWM